MANKTIPKIERVKDALNRIDELACITAEGDLREAKRLARDYNFVFDFILKIEKVLLKTSKILKTKGKTKGKKKP